MATTTPNYGLTKPAGTDPVDISVLNTNADIIDTALHDLDETKAEQADLTEAETTLTSALGEIIDSGQKNILHNTATSAEVNGITFTVNSDGSVTATGTATANADFTISNLTGYPTSGRFVLSGCPEGGGASTYSIQIYQVAADYGSAVEFTSQNRLNVYICISAEQTVDNLIFRPMVCTKAAWSITQEYVPYRPSYDELVSRIAALES